MRICRRTSARASSVESGLNDGGSVPFLMLFIALAADEEGSRTDGCSFAAEQIGSACSSARPSAPSAAGCCGGRRSAAGRPRLRAAGARRARDRSPGRRRRVGGNGFIAAFVGGGAAGVAAGALRERVLDFAEEEGELLNLAVFFIFGVFAAAALGDVTWPMVGLRRAQPHRHPDAAGRHRGAGLGLRPPTVAFIGWFGPRGLASIILGAGRCRGGPGARAGLDQIFVVITVTVLLSVFAHGISAAPLTRFLARREEERCVRSAPATHRRPGRGIPGRTGVRCRQMPPRTRAFCAANSASVRMPCSLRAASSLSCSIGSGGRGAAAGAGGGGRAARRRVAPAAPSGWPGGATRGC